MNLKRKIIIGLRKALLETEGFFDTEFIVDEIPVIAKGFIHREYNKSGDGVNEPVDYELTHQNLELEKITLLFDGFDALMHREEVENIEKSF